MKYNPINIDRIAKGISQIIEDEIAKSGVFYRIFFRCKQEESLNGKLSLTNVDGSPKYNAADKFLRDIIGIRINLYFVDDLEILTVFLKKQFDSLFEEETIDENKTTEFKPTRVNLIFKLPRHFIPEFREVVIDKRIDPTFELQLRTVFSEGWHEVEHDLRYKCQDDWVMYPDMSRTFNGILAALETHEWGIIQMFDRLSYNHYKQRNISAMLRTKLRIRCIDYVVSKEIDQVIKEDESLLKDFFKINRDDILKILLTNKPLFPLSINNIIYLLNYVFLKNEKLISLTPSVLLPDLKGVEAGYAKNLGKQNKKGEIAW